MPVLTITISDRANAYIRRKAPKRTSLVRLCRSLAAQEAREQAIEELALAQANAMRGDGEKETHAD